jgi:ribosomal protein L37AE/L43A
MNRLGLMEGESEVWVWQCRKCGKFWEGGEDRPDGRTILMEAVSAGGSNEG